MGGSEGKDSLPLRKGERSTALSLAGLTVQPQLCHSCSVRPSASPSTSLGLGFLVCNTGVVIGNGSTKD